MTTSVLTGQRHSRPRQLAAIGEQERRTAPARARSEAEHLCRDITGRWRLASAATAAAGTCRPAVEHIAEEVRFVTSSGHQMKSGCAEKRCSASILRRD